MRKVLTMLAMLVLCACTAKQTGQSFIPAAPTVSQPSYNTEQHYIYVTDSTNLLVFSSNDFKAPHNVINLGGFPDGVVVDHEGNVYVANTATNEVDVFSPGAATKIRTITNDVNRPQGLAIDSQDQLYVSGYKGSSSYVDVYAPGASVPNQTIAGVNNYAIIDLALDKNNFLYLDINNGPGSIMVWDVNGHIMKQVVQVGATPAGITFDVNNNLVATSSNYMATYKRPTMVKPHQWIRISYLVFNSGNARLLTRGADGGLYVPVWDFWNGNSRLYVVPVTGNPFTVNGLTKPQGAAEG